MLADPPANAEPAATAMYAPSRDQERPATPLDIPLVANINAVPVGLPSFAGFAQNCSLPASSPTASKVPVGANAPESTLVVVVVSTVNAAGEGIVEPVTWR